jgi:hypothetical protein
LCEILAEKKWLGECLGDFLAKKQLVTLTLDESVATLSEVFCSKDRAKEYSVRSFLFILFVMFE